MRTLTVGIVAHVDAGKTTLTEALLYTAGAIKRIGRVDKGDCFLDTHSIERERGITVFSKQAVCTHADTDITFVDTPGHIDFACETERTLAVLDACILVVSATEPIRAHTKTLWRLLASHRIPVLLFVNKMDMASRTRAEILADLRAELDDRCADFCLSTPRFAEETAAVNEALMAHYFANECLPDEAIRHEIRARRLFPVWFGSALRNDGVRAFLDGLVKYAEAPVYGDLLGLKVFKIARDAQGNRLSYVKVTGGVLRTKDRLTLRGADGRVSEEKVEQLRIYSGDKFRTENEIEAGRVCAMLGPQNTYCGQGIGIEMSEEQAALEPILTYRLQLPHGTDLFSAYEILLRLSEEDPSLHPVYDERHGELLLRLMGDIQAEILRRVLQDRFGLSVTFGQGKILYKETIASCVHGAGHFEPLCHYAEVHLRMTPLSPGSGLVFTSDCSTDVLSLHWQRLVLTHLEERAHLGVLTGSPITDMEIALIGGRAHNKHTEGGDFRQATYRAVRQGLMKADSVLLEPYMSFRIELPNGYVGRAMTDLSVRSATPSAPETDGQTAILTGIGPAATLRDYPAELRAYTRAEGQMQMTMVGYYPCHNTDEVLAATGYDPLLDERHPPHSVFCKNGAGYVVPWDEADALMHVPCDDSLRTHAAEPVRTVRASTRTYQSSAEEDRELMRIFEATYGKVRRRTVSDKQQYTAAEPSPKRQTPKARPRGDTYLLVDGYNIIHAWDDLRALASPTLAHARDTLIRRLCNYAGFRHIHVILVFDAYLVKGGQGSVESYGPVSVVYTKERQTADAYIERASYEIAREHTVRVATSDAAEQLIVLGNGALRITPEELREELKLADEQIGACLEAR